MSDLVVHERTLDHRLDPFDAWRRLHGSRPSVLLDGAFVASELARYAYVLFDPVEIVSFAEGFDPALGGIERGAPKGDPLASLFERLRAFGSLPIATQHREAPAPRFRGGAAGFLAYDLGRTLESLPATAERRSAAPDLWFAIFDRGVEIDLKTGEMVAFVCQDADDRGGDSSKEFFDSVAAALDLAPPPLPGFTAGELVSNFDRAAYEATVERVLEYIREGDVYQLNLAQRFEAVFQGSPAAVYERLRSINPAPFSAFIDCGALAVLSSSPESFLSLRGHEVETRPIKGTRKRTGDVELDASLEHELASNEKEAAELAMVVDLERNDLSKVAAVGSVRVVDPGRIERYATVVHRTAIVQGELQSACTAESLLRATFPGGSITGVPKIRAMEIIEELEGVRRGVFTGAIGFIGFDGSMEISIAIRTLVIEDGRVHFHVGGGIVIDSRPAAEYEETLLKGKALARALGQELSVLTIDGA